MRPTFQKLVERLESMEEKDYKEERPMNGRTPKTPKGTPARRFSTHTTSNSSSRYVNAAIVRAAQILQTETAGSSSGRKRRSIMSSYGTTSNDDVALDSRNVLGSLPSESAGHISSSGMQTSSAVIRRSSEFEFIAELDQSSNPPGNAPCTAPRSVLLNPPLPSVDDSHASAPNGVSGAHLPADSETDLPPTVPPRESALFPGVDRTRRLSVLLDPNSETINEYAKLTGQGTAEPTLHSNTGHAVSMYDDVPSKRAPRLSIASMGSALYLTPGAAMELQHGAAKGTPAIQQRSVGRLAPDQDYGHAAPVQMRMQSASTTIECGDSADLSAMSPALGKTSFFPKVVSGRNSPHLPPNSAHLDPPLSPGDVGGSGWHGVTEHGGTQHRRRFGTQESISECDQWYGGGAYEEDGRGEWPTQNAPSPIPLLQDGTYAEHMSPMTSEHDHSHTALSWTKETSFSASISDHALAPPPRPGASLKSPPTSTPRRHSPTPTPRARSARSKRGWDSHGSHSVSRVSWHVDGDGTEYFESEI